MSTNKHYDHLSNSETLRCHGYWRDVLKKGRPFFKVKIYIHVKFQNSDIVLFEITITIVVMYSPIYSKSTGYFHCFMAFVFS